MPTGIMPRQGRVVEPPPAIHRNPVSVDAVPLAWAGLCLDSDTIYDLRAGCCPACGSKAMLPLSRVLGTDVAS